MIEWANGKAVREKEQRKSTSVAVVSFICLLALERGAFILFRKYYGRKGGELFYSSSLKLYKYTNSQVAIFKLYVMFNI